MEPKSIAFYTAVAIGMLAVLSAGVVPTLVESGQAVTTEEAENNVRNVSDEDADIGENEDADIGENEDAIQDRVEDAIQDRVEDAIQEAEDAIRDNSGGTGESLALASSDGMISCGEVITRDVTLQEDLYCPSDGVIIRGSGIEFNMNGHSIIAVDEDNSVDLTLDYNGNSGILVSNADDVTITGLGLVSGFDRGVAFTGSSGAVVTDVALRDNGVGAFISGSEEIEISKNNIDNNRFGVVSESSDEGIIAFNLISSNAEAGIVLLDSDGNVIAGNGVFGNGETGIFLDAQSSDNIIDYNNVFGHTEADLNNANGMPTNINNNNFGESNNCGTSVPAGLC